MYGTNLLISLTAKYYENRCIIHLVGETYVNIEIKNCNESNKNFARYEIA